jgi:hypothetical protein
MITKRTKIMLVVLVLVALGAYAYLWWWGNTEDHGYFDTVPGLRDVSQSASDAVIRPQPAAPGEETPDTDTPASQTYRTYENTEFGFSFSYPDNWTVSSNSVDPSTTLCLRVSDSSGGCLITIMYEMESVNASMDKTLDALRAEYRAGRIAESSRTVGGENATQFRVSGYPAGEEGATRAAVFMHDRQIYTVSAIAGQEAVFERLVSSFRFQD